MKNVARAFLVIGLVIGGLGAASRLGTFLLADTLTQIARSNESRMPGNYQERLQGLEKATARTPLNILSIAGTIALVALGGTLGLLSLSEGVGTARRAAFLVVAALCGAGLILLHRWAGGAAFALGAVFALIALVGGGKRGQGGLQTR